MNFGMIEKVLENGSNREGIMNKDDEYFMRLALDEARRSLANGEVPVGALLVAGQEILSRAANASIRKNDPSAHAEILAIREACRLNGNYRLPGVDLYVTLEPCPMCLGAAHQARIRRLIYGAKDPKSGAAGSVMTFPWSELNHKIEIKGGILAEECGKILKDFFKTKR